MSLLLSLLIKSDSSDAKSDLTGFRGEVSKTSADVTRLGQAERTGATAAQVHGNAMGAAAGQATALGNANRIAAGQVGNLTAQFNDIGIMMAAGQNPLQLALQQGTQISQVIGPMGARGAVRALGGAFLSLLSPVNLLTIGSIAAGAAMFNWLNEAGDEAETLEDKLGNLKDAMTAIERIDKQLRSPISDLVAVYGAQAGAARQLLEIERQIAEVRARRALAVAARGAADAIGGSEVPRDLSSASIERTAREVAAARELGASTQENIDLLRELGRARTEADNDWLRSLRAIRGTAQAVLDDNESIVTAVQDIGEAFGVPEQEAFRLASAFAAVRDAANPEEQAAAMSSLAAAIFEATGGLTEADDETLALYQSLLEAAQEAQRLASIDVAANLTEAARAAAETAAYLKEALQGFDAWSSIYRARFADEDFLMGQAVLPPVGGTPPKKPRGGGGKNDAERQAEALAQLIQTETDQLAILRATDPVEKEMIRNREALIGATEAQRDQVHQLIEARIAEEAQIAALQEAYDFWGQTALGVFDDLFVSGKDLDDVLAGLTRRLASMAWEATILGTGPLANLFGTSGGGGLFGAVFGALFKAEGGLITGPGGPTEDRVMTFTSPGEYIVRAAQTSKHLPLLEAINSGAIDQMTGYAEGGLLGAISPPIMSPRLVGLGGGAPRVAEDRLLRVEVHLSDDLEARVNGTAEDVAVKVFKNGIEEFSAEALPVRVDQIARDGRARG